MTLQKLAKARKALKTATRAEATVVISSRLLAMRQLIRTLCADTYDEATRPWREAIQATAGFQCDGQIMPAALWLAKRLAEDGVNELARIAMLAAAVDLVEAEGNMSRSL